MVTYQADLGLSQLRLDFVDHFAVFLTQHCQLFQAGHAGCQPLLGPGRPVLRRHAVVTATV